MQSAAQKRGLAHGCLKKADRGKKEVPTVWEIEYVQEGRHPSRSDTSDDRVLRAARADLSQAAELKFFN